MKNSFHVILHKPFLKVRPTIHFRVLQKILDLISRNMENNRLLKHLFFLMIYKKQYLFKYFAILYFLKLIKFLFSIYIKESKKIYHSPFLHIFNLYKPYGLYSFVIKILSTKAGRSAKDAKLLFIFQYKFLFIFNKI